MRLGSLGNGVPSGEAVHSLLGVGRYHITELGSHPDAQVAQTMTIMAARASEDAKRPDFKAHAARIFAGADPSDTQEIINRAFRHVKNAIHFQRDEVSGAGLAGVEPADLIEFIVRPADMARYVDRGIAIGDCDDFSMYLAALLATQGLQTKFCTVAADEHFRDQFSHVYVVCYTDGQRIPLDASHGDYPGWEVAMERPVWRTQEWPACGGCSLVSLAMIAAAGYFGWRMWREAVA